MTPAQASRAGSATAILMELGAALDADGDALAIIERQSRSILWCTEDCSLIHPQLTPGAGVSDIAGLVRVLDAIDNGERPWNTIIANPSRPPKVAGNGNTSPATHTIAPVHVSEYRVTVRFQARARSDVWLHRYMADREKLFTVSRAVSVSEMATTLAHELNQPIGALANLLQGLRVLLTRELGTLTPGLAQALDRASDQTRFAAGVIARIRNFTEARAPRLLPCDIGLIVDDTISLLDWVFDTENVDVRLHADGAPSLVAGDEILLRQVFSNLFRNAVDAMRECPPDARRIDVQVACSESEVSIDIHDSGSGLDDHAQKTLFMPFLSSKRDGMGVGLNICRSFIELHRGRLWLDAHPDGGCVAHVQLPVLDARTANAGDPDRQRHQLQPGQQQGRQPGHQEDSQENVG